MPDQMTMFSAEEKTEGEVSPYVIDASWSAYCPPEKLPFRHNADLRHARFKINKHTPSYTVLGDPEEVDAEDEMTYLHWVHNYLMSILDGKKEQLITAQDFFPMVNLQLSDRHQSVKHKEDDVSYAKDVKRLLYTALSASMYIFTPEHVQSDYLEHPKILHFYFLDNLAKYLVYTQCNTSTARMLNYDTFKKEHIPQLKEWVRITRTMHYTAITWGIVHGKNIALELHTETPQFAYARFHRPDHTKCGCGQ